MSNLAGKTVILGISGSIASYKAAGIASRLTQTGVHVDTCMTPAATRFITPLAIRALTGRAVYVDMFDPEAETAEAHVALARRADAVLVAPATATTIARIAQGMAEDMVSLTVLATRAPVLLAPAMDNYMWSNPATRANVAALEARGMAFVGPAVGRLASGHSGAGRLETEERVLGALRQVLGRGGDLAGRHVVVTAGGTREPIDPVRYVSNHSTGKMGFAVAEAARDRGARVTLIATPSTDALETPYGVERLTAVRTIDLRDAVLAACADADALIMAAAPADFTPEQSAGHKIKKDGSGRLVLELTETPDILQAVRDAGLPLVRVGFAAESRDVVQYAAEKVQRKGLALIVANDITAPDAGFGTDTNVVSLVDAEGRVEHLPVMSKYDVALRILDRLIPLLPVSPGHPVEV